MYNEYVE